MDVLDYKLKRSTEQIGALEIVIETLEDLDQTIDDLFDALKETGRENLLEELCPYFGVVWPSARALARAVERRADSLAGRAILEIGCGLALPSLVAARLGARVTATDFHPEVPRFLKRNLEANSVHLDYRHLSWREPGALAGSRFDEVIGSDILYESYQPAQVARVLSEQLAPGGRALIADPGRPYLQGFVDEMKRIGMTAHVIAEGEIFLLEFQQPRFP